MLIVNLKGGMGNQMFQYALYKVLSMRGKRVMLDVSHIKNDMQLINRSTIFDAYKLDRHYVDFGRVFNKIISRFLMPVFKRIVGLYMEKEEGTLDPELINLKKGYLEGYWQTERYFKEYRTEICKDFSLLQDLSEENKKMLEKIAAEPCAVSLHIRLGDYTTPVNEELFGGICTEEYYKNAVEHIKQKYENAKFFVFSNGEHNITGILPDINYELVNINDENTGWADMYLMSQCDHNIIANSSFSWWGAWLNQNENKTVIAPQKWINGQNMTDICPDEWVRISVV